MAKQSVVALVALGGLVGAWLWGRHQEAVALSRQVAAAATTAFAGWRETPPAVRARSLFRFRQHLEDHLEELARLVATAQEERRGSKATGAGRRLFRRVQEALAAAG
mgnify:CR=1 FL=1